jgi:hypothetical protein
MLRAALHFQQAGEASLAQAKAWGNLPLSKWMRAMMAFLVIAKI